MTPWWPTNGNGYLDVWALHDPHPESDPGKWRNAGLMVGQRLRRWPTIKSTLRQCLVFAGIAFGSMWSKRREALAEH